MGAIQTGVNYLSGTDLPNDILGIGSNLNGTLMWLVASVIIAWLLIWLAPFITSKIKKMIKKVRG